MDYSGKNLPGTTKNTWLVAGYLSPTKNLHTSLWYRYTGKMAVNDANSDYSDEFGITNFEIRYIQKIKRFKFELKGGILNIFDINYASMLAVNAPSFGGSPPRYYYPGNPRNYYISVLFGFE